MSQRAQRVRRSWLRRRWCCYLWKVSDLCCYMVRASKLQQMQRSVRPPLEQRCSAMRGPLASPAPGARCACLSRKIWPVACCALRRARKLYLLLLLLTSDCVQHSECLQHDKSRGRRHPCPRWRALGSPAGSFTRSLATRLCLHRNQSCAQRNYGSEVGRVSCFAAAASSKCRWWWRQSAARGELEWPTSWRISCCSKGRRLKKEISQRAPK